MSLARPFVSARSSAAGPHPPVRNRTAWSALGVAAATLLAAVLLGYHPDAEDGGIYSAAAAARLDPSLFPHDRVWVTAHTRFALFAPGAAALTRLLHLPLAYVLFAVHLAGLAALFAAAAHLARTLAPKMQWPWLPVLFVAVAAGLPVAGTALYVVDPYCTARTLTTPLLLFALSFALRDRWAASTACWVAAALMHPLMAIWGALPLLFVAALASRHPRRWIAVVALLPFVAATLVTIPAAAETDATRAIAHSRAYWFPALWHWYEWIGAAAPCLLLLLAARQTRPSTPPERSALRRLAVISVLTTAAAVLLACCFARESAASLAVARLQPLRSLHLVFLAFLTGIASWMQPRCTTRRVKALAVAALTVLAASLFAMQRSLYPATAHLEWPWRQPTNPWQAAFLWCRDNTPSNALFALDNRYIDASGEDTHGFRAAALRSALPDAVKDAGIAAVLPELTPAWQTGVDATIYLGRIPDAERLRHLQPLGVTWLVLPASAITELPCPYSNTAAKVCRLD